MTDNLPDLQNTKVNSIAIARVGVTRIDFPLTLHTANKELQVVHSTINLYGSLPRTQKGTNMSRFLEVLMEYKGKPLNADNLRAFLQKLIKRIETKDAYAEISFSYFIDKEAPVSKGKIAPLSYKCTLIGRLQGTIYTHTLKVAVPVTSVCPCSKEISKYGAHNQRGYVTVQVQFDWGKSMLLEDLIKIIEKQGSCQVYPILKRRDEKYVTEYGYKHPKFVEDIARDVALALQTKKEIRKFKVKVENFESIHTHNATAYVFRKRKGSVWVSDVGDST
jgi:GTP cyclohydrolase I